jgi:multimeric flavodoxin WrbA
MKVVAFNGSARKDGNTAILIREAFKELEAGGIETEMIQLSGKPMHGCLACYQCAANKDKRCAVTTDYVNTCIEKMLEADGMILGSPVYFTDVSAEMKALIDRAGIVARVNGNMFARKAGAAVVAVRRGGQIHTFDTINHFFLISEMIIPGSNYWNFGIGRDKGEVENDQEGLETIRLLGKNMAWLMNKLAE